MLDRSKPPKAERISEFNFQKAEEKLLGDSIPAYLIEAGSADVSRIDFIYATAKIKTRKILQNALTNKYLIEGTFNKSASEIALFLDSHGAYMESQQGVLNVSTSVYCLNKHLSEVVPYVLEILNKPDFPEVEISKQIAIAKNMLAVKMEEVDYLARRKFPSLIYGEDHIYARKAEPQDYENISRTDLMQWHWDFYGKQNLKVIIAGKNTQQAFGKIEDNLNIIRPSAYKVPKSLLIPEAKTPTENYLSIIKPGAIQTALRIGKILPSAEHEDYHSLKILITVLGGYFGSRLMQNIREDKGYTYGIGAYLLGRNNHSVLIISTEVGAQFTQATREEINKEIVRLQNEAIPESELELVKSYLLGNLVSGFDGAFELANRNKELILDNVPQNFYQSFVQAIQSCKAEHLQELACKYLQPESLKTISVGSE